MSLLNIILLVLVAALVVVGSLAARQPAVGRCARSAVVRGPRERAFALINQLRAWQQWSPWEDVDPSMERRYAGPAAGVGASYTWKGNSKVGEGRMEITISAPHERVVLELVFLKPMAGSMTTTFTLADAPAGTRVEWRSDCPNRPIGRVMGVFINLDKMMGTQFERGLNRLDAALQP